MRLIVAVGNRPNVVKISPLVPEFDRAGIHADIAFTGAKRLEKDDGQDDGLSFYGVAIPAPKWFLDVGVDADASTTGRAMTAFERLFVTETADAVMVVGDSDSTLGAAVAAAKARLPVIHLEAGMRCGDMSYSDEINRVVISRISAMHLTPTEKALENLEDEGIDPERVHFVGQTIAEAVLRNLDGVARYRACTEFGFVERSYVLGCFHRTENVGDEKRLSMIMAGLGASPLPVLMPDSDGLSAALRRYRVSVPSGVRIVDPVGYRVMLALERDAAAIITDSAGVQVEACMVGVACLTVRDCTEVSSTVDVGANRLLPAESSAIRAALAESINRKRSWVAPKRWDRAVADRATRAIRRGVVPLV